MSRKEEEVEETKETKLPITETSVKETPIKSVPSQRCDHKGKLEAVTADEAEISSRLAREKHVKIFRCKSCKDIVIEK